MNLKATFFTPILLGAALLQTGCLDELIDSEEDQQLSPPIASFKIENGTLYSTDADTSNQDLTFSWSVDDSEIGSGNQLSIDSVNLEGTHKVTLTVYDGQDTDSYSFDVDFGEQESVFMTVSDMKNL